MPSENKQLIAKNTLYLYARMLLVMCVTLYTSRVILHTLGATDYGVYSVVGGIVVMFSFLTGSLSGATSRYLSFDLGKGDEEQLKKSFSASLNIYLLIAVLVVILGEIIGLWLLSYKLTIPSDRMTAAYWVLEFSIITAFFNFTQYPYTATLLAHEDMSVYAYVGIYEALSRLAIAYLITVSPIDSLVFYALLIMVNQICILAFYRIYATRKYIECRFRLIRDKVMYKRMLSYSGYDMLPSMSYIFQSQGTDILLNMFFGPVANAARAIAGQVNGALIQVVNNLMQAARPQVIKDYAQGDPKAMYNLTFLVCKFSYILMLAMVVPLISEIDYVILLWLGPEAPPQSALYCRIILFTGLVGIFNNALAMPIHAIGKLRSFGIINSGFVIMPIPVGYCLFRLGVPDYSIFLLVLLFNVIVVVNCLCLLHRIELFSWKIYMFQVLIPCSFITLMAFIYSSVIHHMLPFGLFRFIVAFMGNVVIIALLGWFVAMKKDMREKIKSVLYKKNI